MRAPGQTLRTLSTPQLVRRAVDDAEELLAAELAHARAELQEELQRLRASGVLVGVALCLFVCGSTLLLAAVALGLGWGARALYAFAVPLLLAAAGMGAVAARRARWRLLAKSRQRVREDLELARRELR